MLPFLCPWMRRVKVEWLLDLYVTVKAWNPKARISYIGHSNGTYVLAGALRACRAVSIHNVVFAGSVVRSDFDWKVLQSSRQVGSVLNYVATADWVVAIFPRMLQKAGLQRDLGGAGYDGFSDSSPGVTDIEFVPGRHSAALDELHWPDIAAFVLGGAQPSGRAVVSTQSRIVKAFATGAIGFWIVAIAFVVVPTYYLLTALGFPSRTGGWLWALVLIAWIRIVALVLTRF
jgi:hypothetical protein